MFWHAEGQKAGTNCLPLMRKSRIRLNENSFRFRREERLKGKNEIREVFSKGKRISCQGAKLFLLPNNLPCNRICFTFSRNYGSAVERNRAKRLGKEAYRNLKPELQSGFDLIFFIHPDASKTGCQSGSLAERVSQLRYLFAKGGLLK